MFCSIDLLQNTGQISKKFCEMHRLIEGDLIHILHLQYFSIFMKKIAFPLFSPSYKFDGSIVSRNTLLKSFGNCFKLKTGSGTQVKKLSNDK